MMRKVWAFTLLTGVIVWPGVRFVLTCFVTWLLWRASVGLMVPLDLPLAFTQPDFLVYLSFWCLVSLGILCARNIWRGE